MPDLKEVPTAAAPAWKRGVVLPPAQLTPQIIAQIKGALTPAETLALTAWAEARSRLYRGRWVANPPAAMLDVMHVVNNRAHDRRWREMGHKGVCLQRWQFSCWEPKGGPDDPHDTDDLAENFEALMERAQLAVSRRASDKMFDGIVMATRIIGGQIKDGVGGACHYYAEWMSAPPKWAAHRLARLTAHRHGHLFFAGVP